MMMPNLVIGTRKYAEDRVVHFAAEVSLCQGSSGDDVWISCL